VCNRICADTVEASPATSNSLNTENPAITHYTHVAEQVNIIKNCSGF